MQAETLATAAGAAGALLTLWMAVPQTGRIWRDGSAVGVSAATWTLFCLSFALWIGYSVRVTNAVTLVSNIFALTSASVLVVGLMRVSTLRRGQRIGVLVALVAGCMALSAVGLAGPLPLVAVLLVSGIFERAPQVLRSAVTFRTLSLSEVALGTWWASLASGACWGVHGALRPDGFILAAAVGVFLLSAGVLALELAAARRRVNVVPAVD